MKYLFFLFGGVFFIQASFSQAPKISVAIAPFAYAMPEYRNRASQIQEIVVEVLGKKSNILIIDRSKDTLLQKELNKQISEFSIAAKNLVQQGRVLGAQNMIAGTVSNVTVEEERSSSKNILTGEQSINTTYKASISFSLQLMDVETGKIISQKSFDNNAARSSLFDLANFGTGNTKEGAVAAAMKSSKKMILAWINESYPPDIRIIKIDERDKKGFPETVLVTGIDASLAKGAKLTLNEVEMLDAGEGRKVRRSKKIAELKITEVQGDITVCKVTDGEKELEGKMTSGAKLEILIK